MCLLCKPMKEIHCGAMDDAKTLTIILQKVMISLLYIFVLVYFDFSKKNYISLSRIV